MELCISQSWLGLFKQSSKEKVKENSKIQASVYSCFYGYTVKNKYIIIFRMSHKLIHL